MNKSKAINRRRFLTRGAVATGGAALGVAAILNNAACCKKPAENEEDFPVFLFVQTCKSAHLADGKLTLNGVSASTLYFSDRPERIAGHLATEAFIEMGYDGEDSFASDNPNAALSIIHDDFQEEIVLVLNNPTLSGDTLVYDVKVLDGPKTASGEMASLFIDGIGRPMTPTSVDGRHRRHRRP